MSKYPQERLAADTADLSWLAGNWQGETGEAQVIEQWAATTSTMMGMFCWQQGQQVRFYEFMTIAPEEQGVVLRIKHFNPGLIGWEEKDVAVAFDLVQMEAGKAVFLQRKTADPTWLVYHRVDDCTLLAYFEDEKEPQDIFRFTKQKS